MYQSHPSRLNMAGYVESNIYSGLLAWSISPSSLVNFNFNFAVIYRVFPIFISSLFFFLLFLGKKKSSLGC